MVPVSFSPAALKLKVTSRVCPSRGFGWSEKQHVNNEIQLLETLAEETAIALQNSRLCEDLLHRMEGLREAQAQLIQ